MPSMAGSGFVLRWAQLCSDSKGHVMNSESLKGNCSKLEIKSKKGDIRDISITLQNSFSQIPTNKVYLHKQDA